MQRVYCYIGDDIQPILPIGVSRSDSSIPNGGVLHAFWAICMGNRVFSEGRECDDIIRELANFDLGKS